MTAAPFRILTVCTGNICRSPYAEHALRRALRDQPEIEVVSAGTGAVIGAPATPETEAAATRSGFTTEGHEARQLDRAIASDADLILALTRDHRRDTVLTWPRANRIAFTLTEFARLADSLDDADLADGLAGVDGPQRAPAVALLSRRRGLVPAPSPSDDDIDDPYLQGDAVYEAMRLRVDAATASVARLMGRLRG